MAERRMFTRKITDDDRFMQLSSSAQALYLHLSMNADDDGFSNQVSVAMFRAHASVQDLEALLSGRFIYQFDSGVIVIKHWRMANALRKDRYTATTFKNELSMLSLDENGAYTMGDGCHPVATWLPDGCQVVAERLPQDRIGKDRKGKDNNEADKRPTRSKFIKPTVEDIKAFEVENGYPIEAQNIFDYYEACGWVVGKNKPMKSWQAAVRSWHNRPWAKKAVSTKTTIIDQKEAEWVDA